MATLIVIGLLGGLITGISPCILPMLPVIFFAGGVQGARDQVPAFPSAVGLPGLDGILASAPSPGSRPAQVALAERPTAARSWRPYLVIAGLVLSFSLFTLLGSLILGALGLPQDVARWVGLVLLTVIGVGMIVPRVEEIIERPFQRLAALGARRGAARQDRGAFVLGLGLGVLYVPCAGPVLAAITVAGATGSIGPETVALTVSFAVGAAIPLLAFALAGRRVAERVRGFRAHTRGVRIVGGVTMIVLAVALAFNVPAAVQRVLPDYVGALQSRVNSSDTVQQALDLGGIVTDENKGLSQCSDGADVLQECGPAPAIRGIDAWLNTPGGAPVDLEDLRGRVVLIDFWTYSCINCQRAIPHVEAWYDRYRNVGAGFEVIGVHTPEFAFEHELRNVRAGAQDLGVTYPIAQDNSYATWTAYRNRYWPAEYLIDAQGTVRHIRFGEGGYEDTETLIRELLAQANPGVDLPPATTVRDETPAGTTTPETYFSVTKVRNYSGAVPYRAGPGAFTTTAPQPPDTFSLGGSWTLDAQGATAASDDAQVRLAYRATDVYVVLGGEGTVTARVEPGGEGAGRTGDESTQTRRVEVTGAPSLYPILQGTDATSGIVELDVPAGVEVYTFTFG